MNILDVPDYIETNDTSSICSLTPEYSNGQNLHPSDKLLLTDPARATSNLKSETVSFLRRTQYISSERGGSEGGAANDTENTIKQRLHMKKDDGLDPKTQLRAVEEMFGTNLDVKKLRHPVKKHLKAKKVWHFLPDTSMMDQKFFDLKFASSASISKGKNKKREDIKNEKDPRLLTAMFRDIQFNEGKLVSMYTTTEDNALEIKKVFDDKTENAPISEEEAANPDLDTNPYVYKKLRDYDGQIKNYNELESLNHLVISFDEESSTALYVPVSGRVELKKRRIDPLLEPKVKELTYDQIYLSVREPTRAEIDERDLHRSNYDPMEFGADEDEYEQDEETEAAA
ncbi:unnamed protein product [Ambrosiozyma monospora]|uniref:Unnamed protein product n=1 Tax=Ambrosiozyma monospora TaxID=43982 RepID=A0ACB5SYL2_AMBMO|nr:unnamed protein product [Ambrosiozyma monospora]